MSGWSWLWLAWLAAFLAVEIPAAVRGDRPGRPRTLSAHVWWLIQGRGRWHYTARLGLVVLLAWLSIHLLTGGWI